MRDEVVIALVIVLVIVSAGAGYFIGTSNTHSVTTTITNSAGGRAYQVTFQQVPYCGKYNVLPWAVTFNGLTEVQPSNQSLPLETNHFATMVPDQNLTRITFSVPNGIYHDNVSNGFVPYASLRTETSTVHVNGSDVTVPVWVQLSPTC